MDRRDFLKSTGGIAALATGAALPAAATSTAATENASGTRPSDAAARFTFVSPWQAHHAGFSDDAHRLARRIEAALGGAILLDQRMGTVEPAAFAFLPAHTEISRHPAFAYFGGLPGQDVLSARDIDAWLATGGGQALWDDLAAGSGFKPLLAGHTGSHPVLWSRTPVRAPQDLAGRRIIARGLDAEVLRACGAVPVCAREHELEAALTDAATDAVVWGSLVQASAAGIPERFPHGLAGAFGAGGSALMLRIDLSLWQSLTQAQQSALEAAASAEFRAALADTEATRRPVAQAIALRHRSVIGQPSAEFASAISRIAAAVIAHTAAHDAMAARIDQSYAAFRRAIETPDVNMA